LNYTVQGGTTYNFGVLGDNGDGWDNWWGSASNAALSGTPQQGADGKYLEFNVGDLSSVTVWDSKSVGWDKSSDINVQVYGTAISPQGNLPVPEPITMAGVLLGVGALGRYWSRKHRIA